MDAEKRAIDAELRAILVEHGLEYGAWRLARVGILTKGDLPSMWAKDQDLFGEDGYSRGTLQIFKNALRKYAPSGE
jgi:hypothetical protein